MDVLPEKSLIPIQMINIKDYENITAPKAIKYLTNQDVFNRILTLLIKQGFPCCRFVSDSFTLKRLFRLKTVEVIDVVEKSGWYETGFSCTNTPIHTPMRGPLFVFFDNFDISRLEAESSHFYTQFLNSKKLISKSLEGNPIFNTYVYLLDRHGIKGGDNLNIIFDLDNIHSDWFSWNIAHGILGDSDPNLSLKDIEIYRSKSLVQLGIAAGKIADKYKLKKGVLDTLKP